MNDKRIYQILIVDDEPYILQTISMLLEEHVPYELEIFQADSATKALTIMSRRKIDILITDIQMPNIDGLKLTHIVRQHWKDCITIILTAYADFSYLRFAMKEDVFGYVLKSENDDLLIEELLKAIHHVEEKIDEIEQFVSSQMISNERISFLIQETFSNLIHNAQTRVPRHYTDTLHALNCKRPDQPVIAFCITLPEVHNDECAFDALQLLTQHYLMPVTDFICKGIIDDRYYGILQLLGNIQPDALQDIMSNIIDQYTETTGNVAICLLSPTIADANEFSIICGRFVTYKAMNTDLPFVHMININSESISYANTILKQVTDYIDTNIFGDIRLETLAHLAGYNATYLSRLFLKHMGKNLSSYIAEHKMEQITALLKNPDNTIQCITEISGFESKSTFNRFVKRMTGLTPKHYRETLTTTKPD